jgi:hypothetical protein
MAIKLTPAKPDDRYARLYYGFETLEGETFPVRVHEDEASEDTPYIEFWSEDAKTCKDAIRRIAGRLYILQERREKRKSELSEEKAWAEIDEYNRLSIEGFAHRVKAWSLKDSEGNAIDAPVTFENAKSLFEDGDLRNLVAEFIRDKGNFQKRASNS